MGDWKQLFLHEVMHWPILFGVGAMAGILKKIPCCTDHGKPCFIKTGTKDGPMKGKMFFICGNQQQQCSFAVPANGISASTCPRHNTINDLQALCKKDDGIRCYYRCAEGRKFKVGWCGFENVLPGDDFGKQLTDVTNRPKEQANVKSLQKTVNDPFLPDKKAADKLPVAEQGKENEEMISNTCLQNPNPSDHNSVKAKNQSSNQFLSALCERQSKSNAVKKSIGDGLGVDEGGICGAKHNKQAIDEPGCASASASTTNSAQVKMRNPSEVIVINDDDGDQNDTTNLDQASETFCSNENGNSSDHESRQLLLMQQNALERELQNRKANINKVNLHLLPDRGRRLIDHIKELERTLDELRRRKIEAACSEVDSDSNVLLETGVSLHEREHPGGIQEPGLNLEMNLPRNQGLFQVSNHLNKQKLYEGRMTNTKLKQVGKVTRDAIETLHRSLETCPSAITESEDPIGLLVTLMPHQRQGLAWLLWRERQMPSGGILADDMGLGKTLTSIALILKDKQLGFEKKSSIPTDLKDSSGTLIICPASLVHHWKKEIDRRVKPLKLTVCLYHGQMREKNVERLTRYDVVLTTYSIVAMEAKDLVETEASKKKANAWLNTKDPPNASEKKKNRDSLICQIHWRRIILDEAHNIKNPKCMTSIAACYLEAESRWGLTGTPIQNNTKDLYAIIKFLRCCPFDEFKVWRRWVDDKSARGTERMNTLVRSLLLRRTKQQHLTCLPSRDSIIHSVSLDAKEKEVYELLQLYSKNMLTKFLDNRGKDKKSEADFHGKETNTNRIDEKNNQLVFGKHVEQLLEMFGLLNNNINAGAILLMVLRLRQCCSHLSLLREVPEEAECKEDGIEIPLEEQMMNMSIVDAETSQDEWNPDEFKQSFVSSKLRCLLEELQKLKSISTTKKRIKSVVVSQWTKMLDIVALHLRRNGFKYDFITGSVSLKKRSEIVEDFNTNPHGTQIMLVSLRAGGVGLNLIGGSHLFLVDQHWNPALESQACDRIYRVGQQNDVVIHRFLCTDTVEEKIAALQEKKKTLADNVLKGGKQTGNNLTLQDLRVLFGV